MTPLRPRFPVHPLVRQAWDMTSPTMPRQLAIPSGVAHLVIRFSGPPITLGELGAPRPRAYGRGVAVGLRSTPWVRLGGTVTGSVGLTLAPWAMGAVLGVPAAELAGQHHALEDVLGAEGRRLVDRVVDGPAEHRLTTLLAWVTARLQDARHHPAIPAAVERLTAGLGVREVVAGSGLSHRRFIELFVRELGVRPRELRRLARLHRAIALLGRGTAIADAALEVGYADQAHLTRDVVALTGDTPGAIRRRGPFIPGHVPWPPS